MICVCAKTWASTGITYLCSYKPDHDWPIISFSIYELVLSANYFIVDHFTTMLNGKDVYNVTYIYYSCSLESKSHTQKVDFNVIFPCAFTFDCIL